MKSVMEPDHPKLTLDSLHEEADSPVQGLVHRYPDKALFLRMYSPPNTFIGFTVKQL
jgi:L-lysine 2,3-aminomutase